MLGERALPIPWGNRNGFDSRSVELLTISYGSTLLRPGLSVLMPDMAKLVLLELAFAKPSFHGRSQRGKDLLLTCCTLIIDVEGENPHEAARAAAPSPLVIHTAVIVTLYPTMVE